MLPMPQRHFLAFASIARFVVAAGAMFVAFTSNAGAQAVGYDVTRTFTECTHGPTSACAELSMRTYGLAGGGSHVAIGVSNLQGSSPLDNLSGSLLYQATFTMANSAGSVSEAGSVTGTPTGSALGGPNWNFGTTGSSIGISTPSYVNSYYTVVGVPFDYYSWGQCIFHICPLLYNSGSYAAYSRHTTQYDAGIAGADAATHSRTVATNTGYTTLRAGVYTEDFLYDCGAWVPCTGTRTVINNTSVDAGVLNYFTELQYATGSTPASSAYWFSFDSQNQYDARDIANANFWGYDTSDGSTVVCDAAHGASCDVYNDTLLGGDIAPAPEPAMIVLMATGLAGVGFIRRRRRK